MIDTTTWAVLGLTLTLIGLLVSLLVWRRRGPAAGLRAVAWALVPAAAGLTGVLRLGAEVADAVGSWAARLVFSPTVWLGLAVAATSGVLFVVSGMLLRRRPSGKEKGRPALQQRGRPAAGADTGLDDDVEAILRRHGIS